MKTKVYLHIIFILAFALNSFSQRKEFEFKNFTQEDGLPSNESYFVYRDSKDFLWFATDQGVVRYNGNKMEHFNLPDNVIFKIREDSRGRIWFFSHTGKLSYFFNGVIYPFRYNNNIAKAVKNILITDAYINDNDEIIISSGVVENLKILESGAIEKFSYESLDARAKTTFRITQINENQLFAQYIILPQLQSDTFCIQLMAEDRDTTYQIPLTPGTSGFHHGAVSTKEKEIFFFYHKVIVRLNRDGSFKVRYFPYDIISIAAGENIWVGFSKHGAMLLDSELNEVYSEPVLKDKTVTSIRSDHEGGLWFSTLEKGIFYLKNSHITHLFGDSTLSGPVFRIYDAGDNSILYANTTGIHKLTGSTVSLVLHQNSTKVTDLYVDQSKNIYLVGSTDFEGNISSIFKKSADNYFNNVFFITAYSELVQPSKNKYVFSGYNGFYGLTLGTDLIPYKNSNAVKWDFNVPTPKPGILFYDSKKLLWMGTINALYKFNSIKNLPIQFKPNDILSLRVN